MKWILALTFVVSTSWTTAAHAQSRSRFKIEEVQATLAVQGLDGWLLVGDGDRNAIANDLVNPEGKPGHPWFFLISAQGPSRVLVHADDTQRFAGTGASVTLTYQSDKEQRRELGVLLQGKRRVAMEYAPDSKIVSLTRVDKKIARRVAALKVEVVSSANLVQFTKSLWGPQGRVAHYVAAHHLDALRKQAFAYVAREVRAGREVTEYDVQQFLVKGYLVRGLEGDPPVVAAGENTAKSEYVPSKETTRAIARGDLLRLTLWAKMSAREGDWPRPIYANVSWMGFVGDTVPKDYADAFAVAAKARDAAVALIRDRIARKRAVKGYQAARAARDVVSEAGLGQRYLHRTGHSLDTAPVGDGANLDDLAVRDTRALVRGSGFTVEPGLFFEDFGVKTEINVFLGRKGVEVTTAQQSAIIAILKTP